MRVGSTFILCGAVLISLSCSDKSKEEASSKISNNSVKQITQTSENRSPDKGEGPVSSVKLGPINQNLADEGKTIFQQNCSSCHAMKSVVVGPPLGNITQENTPEYIMNMILNPTGMEQKDPEVQQLVKKYNMRMPNTGLDSTQARAVLEYLRTQAGK